MAYPYNSYQNPYQYYPMYQQPQMQQPVMQQAPQAQQQNTNQPTYYTGRIWVSGRAEADAFPVAPNNAVDLWDRNGKILYQKKADMTGRPTMTICDITERAENASDGVSEQGDKLPAYATKDELSAVVGVVRGFDGVIDGIKGDIDTLKNDMYGLSGRKKTSVKKQGEE